MSTAEIGQALVNVLKQPDCPPLPFERVRRLFPEQQTRLIHMAVEDLVIAGILKKKPAGYSLKSKSPWQGFKTPAPKKGQKPAYPDRQTAIFKATPPANIGSWWLNSANVDRAVFMATAKERFSG